MNEDKKPIYWMVLFGIVRHLLGIAGGWLVAKGLIDTDTHDRLMSEGVTQVVGYLLMLVPIVWSVLQKKQVGQWLRTALHMPPQATVGEIPAEAPGSGRVL